MRKENFGAFELLLMYRRELRTQRHLTARDPPDSYIIVIFLIAENKYVKMDNYNT